MSEHLKYAGNALVDDITNLFNLILNEKQVPKAFKTGILTQFLKKVKGSHKHGSLPRNSDAYHKNAL